MGKPALPGVAACTKLGMSTDRANGVVEGTFAAIGPGLAFPVWGPMNLVIYGVATTTLTVAASGANAATVASGTNVRVGDSIQSTLVPPGTTLKTVAGTDVTFAFPTQTWPCVLSNEAAIHFAKNTVPVGLTLSTLVGAALTDPNGFFGAGVTVLGVGADGKSLQLSAAPTGIPVAAGPVPIEFAVTANSLVAGADAAATYVGATTPLGGTVSTIQVERSFDGGSTWVVANLGGSGQLAQFVNLASPVSVAFGDPEAGMLYRVNAIAFSSATAGTALRYRWSTTGQGGTSLQAPAIT